MLGEDIPSAQECFECVSGFLELFFVFGIDGHVHSEVEVFLLSSREARPQFLDILHLRVQRGVAYKTLVRIDALLGSKLGQPLLEILHDESGIHRIYEHRHVEFDIPVYQWREPVSFEEVRIGVHEEGPDVCISDLYLGGVDLDHRWSDGVFEESKCLLVFLLSFPYLFGLFFGYLRARIIDRSGILGLHQRSFRMNRLRCGDRSLNRILSRSDACGRRLRYLLYDRRDCRLCDLLFESLGISCIIPVYKIYQIAFGHDPGYWFIAIRFPFRFRRVFKK